MCVKYVSLPHTFPLLSCTILLNVCKGVCALYSYVCCIPLEISVGTVTLYPQKWSDCQFYSADT